MQQHDLSVSTVSHKALQRTDKRRDANASRKENNGSVAMGGRIEHSRRGFELEPVTD
jgi:hypothetical protein